MIWVVFSSLDEFEQFRNEFPSTLADPDTILGSPVTENADGSGRCFIAHTLSAEECAFLQMAGAMVRVGGLDGPEFSMDSEQI